MVLRYTHSDNIKRDTLFEGRFEPKYNIILSLNSYYAQLDDSLYFCMDISMHMLND